MKASIIIPYRDRIEHLLLTIQALTNQSMSSNEYEIIVIDDGSAQSIQHLLAPTVKLIRIPHQGAATARNYGINIATGEIIIFVDSDIIVEKSFVQEHYDFQKTHLKTIGLGARWHLDSTGAGISVDSRIQLLTNYGKIVSELNHPWYMVFTCNVSLPTKLAKSEQFDTHYIAWGLEDSEWGYRLYLRGCLFEFVEKASCIHLYHDRVITSEKYKGWEANLAYTIKKHPELSVIKFFKEAFNPAINANYIKTYDKFEGSAKIKVNKPLSTYRKQFN